LNVDAQIASGRLLRPGSQHKNSLLPFFAIIDENKEKKTRNKQKKALCAEMRIPPCVWQNG